MEGKHFHRGTINLRRSFIMLVQTMIFLTTFIVVSRKAVLLELLRGEMMDRSVTVNGILLRRKNMDTLWLTRSIPILFTVARSLNMISAMDSRKIFRPRQ